MTTSEWGQIQDGVPQGSVLCSLLFLMYRNYITDNIQTPIKLFVYDLYITFNEIDKATNQLNIDLDKITRWAYEWLVSFNTTKHKPILVTLKQNMAPPLLITINLK